MVQTAGSKAIDTPTPNRDMKKEAGTRVN